MASRIMTGVKVYMAGFDLSGSLNACSLAYGAEMQDATVFANDTRVNAGGLKSVRAEHQGYWSANGTDAPDDVIFSRIGTPNLPMTICPTDGSVGEVAYTFRSVSSEYTTGGNVGDLMPFGLSADGDGGEPPIRGLVLQAAGSETATGTGTAVEVGAASSGQRIYAALHVLSASGTAPTLDVVVQSDVDSSFGSPVTVLTFDQQTAVGSDWQSAAGPNTDTYYRVSWTHGGTSPDFSFVVVLGIA